MPSASSIFVLPTANPPRVIPMEYNLSSTLIADGPVRALAYLPSGLLVSGSETGAITCFPLLPVTEIITDDSLSVGHLPANGDSTKHPHHITALIHVPENHPLSGGYVSGCKDNLIRVFNSSHELVASLTGHEKAVTSLSWLTLGCYMDENDNNESESSQVVPPLLLSGSWDGTAKIWNLVMAESANDCRLVVGTCLATLSGHENTVCVQGLPPPVASSIKLGRVGHLVTTSAGIAQGNTILDHSVRFWEVTFKNLGTDATSCMVELKRKISNDHDGPIRGVTMDHDSGRVFTCSNDATVKVRKGWTMNSTTDVGSCVNTLSFTSHGSAPMLLSVACLEPCSVADHGRGVVSSGEDGSVIVWQETMLDPQIILHPDCVWSVLPLPDGDFATACHDGIIRIFSKNPDKLATAEELAAFHDAVEEARAKHRGGPSQEDIAKLVKWEINYTIIGKKEGAVQVFNKGGRAIAAQWSQASRTWIEVGEVTGSSENSGTIQGKRYDHVLPIEVDAPSGGVRQLQIGYNNGENPFVTAQQFINEHMLDQYYLSQIADYIRSRVGNQAAESRTIGEEVPSVGPTSTSSYTTRSLQYIPMKGYLSFETGADKHTLEKISTKIREFNNTLNNNLPPCDVVDGLNNLCLTLSATSRYHASTVLDTHLNIMYKMIKEWNFAHIFPALDLARLAVLHPDASKAERQGFWLSLFDITLLRCQELNDYMGEGSVSTNVPMLSLRLFTNAFSGGTGSSAAIVSRLGSVIDFTEAHILSSNKNIRLAAATILLNTSSYLEHHSASALRDSTILERSMSLCKTIIESNIHESESIVRVLVTLGTCILCNKDAPKNLALTASLRIANVGYSGQARSVCDEVLSLLS